MILIPVSITQVNWRQFLATVSDTESRDLGRSVDLAGIKAGTPQAYYKVLREFAITPSDAKVKRFLRVAFLTDLNQTFLEPFDLNVLKSKNLSIIDGDLNQWEQAVISACHSGVYGGNHRVYPEETVELFNGVLQFFESIGLNELWSDFRKRDLGNGLFLLE